MTHNPTTTGRTPVAANVIGTLAGLGVVGSAFMALSHSGVQMPGLDAPALPPVAISFAVGALLYAVVAWATFTRRTWAWPSALTLNAIAFASTVMPWRGLDRSGIPAAVTLAALAVLVSRPGREAMLYRRDR